MAFPEELQRSAPAPARFTMLTGLRIVAKAPDGSEMKGTLAHPVRLEFTVDAEFQPAGLVAEDLGVFFWDGTNWIEIGPVTVTFGEGGVVTVSAPTDHFTLFSVMHRPAALAQKPAPAVVPVPTARGFNGSLAAAGISLAQWRAGTVTDAIATPGVRVRALWVFRGGVPIGYIAGAPDFVNSGFIEAFPGGVIPPGTFLAVVTGA